VAAVIVKDKRIISTGHNGTRGREELQRGGCPAATASGPRAWGPRFATSMPKKIHHHPIGLSWGEYQGGTIYTTFSPCLLCTKMIINSGVGEVVYNTEYPMGDASLKLLAEAKVQIRQLQIK
jgi:dCMP deaminase